MTNRGFKGGVGEGCGLGWKGATELVEEVCLVSGNSQGYSY